jgi:DnaJ homolog subfamily C member 28
MNRLESLTEKRLREAIENGEFDDLPGKGEPIDLKENPFEDPDLRVVHRLLRNAGFAPAWIEERKDIEAEFEAARTKLPRAWALFGKGGKSPSDPEWERSLSEFREKVAELNQRTRIYNLKAPAAVFHRRHIDADKIIEAIMCNANC